MKWTLLLTLCLTLTATANDLAIIRAEVEENVQDASLHDDFTILLRAIRKAENGRREIAFGIMDNRARTFKTQAGWCAATCYKNWIRWLDTDQEEPYLVFLQKRYAPIGVSNDPDSLNANWLSNVCYWIKEFSR